MKKILHVFLFLALISPVLGQIGTFSLNLDSLETMDATTATWTNLTKLGAADFYVQTFKDADSDGRMFTFSCSSAGVIDDATTDSWEWLPAASLSQYFSVKTVWADGYLAIAYDNGGTGVVSTVPISLVGDITETFTSSYTFKLTAENCAANIVRVAGTGYYILSYGLSNGLWLKSLAISAGIITLVDSMRITGLDSRYHLHCPYQLLNTNYFLLGKATSGSNKSGAFSFEMDITNGNLGAAAIDSLGWENGGVVGSAHFFYLINDSTIKATKIYIGALSTENNGYPYNFTFAVNPTNGDIGTGIDSYYTSMGLGSKRVIPVGDDWYLISTNYRTFKLLKIAKADGDVGASYAYSKQYGPTTFAGDDMLSLSFSAIDSTAYILYSLGGKDSDAWVHSFSVKGGRFAAGRPGKITTAIIDSIQICTNTVGTPRSYARMGVTGTYWVAGYRGTDNLTRLKTYSCTPTGDIGTVTDSLAINTNRNALNEIDICYTGGDYIGIIWEDVFSGTSLPHTASVAINAATGEIGSAVTSLKKVAGDDIIAPKIFRIQTSSYYALVYGIYGNGGSTNAGWLKTYTINNADGSWGPSGSTTLHATDSLKITTGYYTGKPAICRVGSSDYYAILTSSTASGVIKLYTIDINSTTGAIGNTWADSITVPVPAGGLTRASIQRMGVVEEHYLISASYAGSCLYSATIGISAADGNIDAAITDSWTTTTNVTYPSPPVAVGGDIYAFIAQGANQDGYIRTIEVDDTTAKFIPSVTKDYMNEFEFNPSYSVYAVICGKISGVNSAKYQTSYLLYESQDSSGKLWLYSGSVLGELDEFESSHKIWGLTPSKIWGVASPKKVFGL